MKIRMAAGIALLTAMNVHGEQVLLYVDGEILFDVGTVRKAEYLATRMFARIGVSVKWQAGNLARKRTAPAGPPHTYGPIEIKVTSETPHEKLPGALGYAEIFAGSPGRIFVLADRVKSAGGARVDTSTVLAHVLVHEVTHVLEGVNRHSETGVMKAFWTAADYMAMGARPLEFAPADIEMIQARLARYNAADRAHDPGTLAADRTAL